MKIKNNFKQEWTNSDFDKVYEAIIDKFGDKSFLNQKNEVVAFPNNIEDIEKILGLPYTTHSMCAMISLNCNMHILFEYCKRYHYDFVAIIDNNVEFFIQSNNLEKYKQINKLQNETI